MSHFFSPLYLSPPCAPLPLEFSFLSSCPGVIRINFLASPFPILLLTSPCLFFTYQLCFLFPVPFPAFSPFPFPADNPPYGLHFCDSFPILVVCLVCFCFCFKVQLLIVVSLEISSTLLIFSDFIQSIISPENKDCFILFFPVSTPFPSSPLLSPLLLDPCLFSQLVLFCLI